MLKHIPQKLFAIRVGFACLLLLAVATAGMSSRGGWWSRRAEPCPNPVVGSVPFASPSDRLVLRIDPPGRLSVWAGHRRLAFAGDAQTDLPLMEAGWTADSHGFWLTASDGGLVGSWSARLYSVRHDRVEPLPNATRQVLADMRRRFSCLEPDEPANVGVVAWKASSGDAWLVAEVPPHSVCRHMGAFVGYVVVPSSGRVVERLTEAQILRQWRGELGSRLRAEEPGGAGAP